MATSADKLHRLSVGLPQAGTRLDKWLALALPEMSRSRLQALIGEGRVSVDGVASLDSSRKLRGGESIALDVPPPEPATPVAEQIALTIVYEDDYLIVVDKPAGMVVHPAPGNQSATLVNALLHHCGDSLSGIGGVRRPGIVHRLDKDTSGLLVAAKTDEAHHSLSAQFARHDILRAYRALCWGVPVPAVGEIDAAIGRSPTNRKKMAIVRHGGRHALTRYRLLRAYGNLAAWLECRLATGRTHQIRVHLTSIGHPLVGDPTYGRNTPRKVAGMEEQAVVLTKFPRQALHAFQLGFTHPISGKEMAFESDIPMDIREILDALGDP